MKRKIIQIDHEKCNGCGACIPDCPEGALQLIDGKARLVSDLFCDGLGACTGACPTGAMTVEEREAEPYDEARVMENIVKQGTNVIKAHLSHLNEHGETKLLAEAIGFLKSKSIAIPGYVEKGNHHGCPGSMMRDMRRGDNQGAVNDESGVIESALRQWPVQLALVNPQAPYFEHEELLVTADCVPIAFADYHRRYLRNRPVVMFCPKLDKDTDRYIEKLSLIISSHTIKRIIVVRMEVPCCGGSTMIIEEAVNRSGKKVIIREQIISIDGKQI